LTPELIASAYKDRDARDLLLHARRARLIQDSALVSYDANSYQRVSAWLGFGRDRPRLVVPDGAGGTTMRWIRDVALLESPVRARRCPDPASEEATDEMSRIRRHGPRAIRSGSEPLWSGQEPNPSQADTRW